ncbi:hypothetical protein DBR47_05270 [Paucibacter sp. KBW04]|nr:hypothetical protein DBR47_05270 [Paucibacter sp. KBW04]
MLALVLAIHLTFATVLEFGSPPSQASPKPVAIRLSQGLVSGGAGQVPQSKPEIASLASTDFRLEPLAPAEGLSERAMLEVQGEVAPVADELDYWPRPLLTQAPTAQQAPELEWPKEASALIGSYIGVLRLFIDEAGAVQSVQMDDPPLPEPLALAAKRAFLSLRFRPGELNGQQVKSWMRVEVRFDAEPGISSTPMGS